MCLECTLQLTRVTYIENIHHEHGGRNGILCNSSEKGQPISQPNRLVVQHGCVKVELVVQQDIDAIVSKQLDDVHQPVESCTHI